jgi:phenylacetic acid degradation operon negative regulatory protein
MNSKIITAFCPLRRGIGMVYIAAKPSLLIRLKNNFINSWIADFLAGHTLRANSLIVTVYGDAIAPHGGSVWLGSLIKLMLPFGLNPRMVRTSVFRLARENWLEAEQVGRKSFYRLSKIGLRRFEHAFHRIYDQPKDSWRDDWQLVLLGNGLLEKTQSESLRRELQWEGFGMIAPGIMARPGGEAATLNEILKDTQAKGKVVTLQAQSLDSGNRGPLQDVVHQCWKLDALAADYQHFMQTFKPLLAALKQTDTATPEQYFMLRTLLIHEYRRAMLRDPQLPHQLLPRHWPGASARELAKNIYGLTQKNAEQHLLSILESKRGPLPDASPEFYRRFGGLRAGRKKTTSRAPS